MIEVNEHGIPVELRERPRPQCVLWQDNRRNGKSNKIPERLEGGPASSTNPSTWSTFLDAFAAYNRGNYAGIGFVLAKDDDIEGVDFDACIDPITGVMAPWAKEKVDRIDSYTEISPSGTGVKVFFKGTGLFGGGKKKSLPEHGSIGDKTAGIEAYSHSRYFCLTGKRWEGPSPNVEHRDLSWLKEELWPGAAKQLADGNGELQRPIVPLATNLPLRPWDPKPIEPPAVWDSSLSQPAAQPSTEPAPPQAPISASVPASGPDVLQRASLYVTQAVKCDPPTKGQHGHDKLLWLATALKHGFCLSNDQALEILIRDCNPSCLPPWNLQDPRDYRDFTRKITEAEKLTPDKPRGWLLEDSSYAPTPVSQVQLEAVKQLIENSQAKQQTDIPSPASVQVLPASDPKELEFLVQPPGLLGEICEWIDGTALRYQPFLTLACALTFLGALFGRKIKDHLGSRTNLYCMSVAKSSAGKAHAPDEIRELTRQAGCIDLLGGSEVTSDTAIESRLEQHPATLYLWDEIGHKFIDLQTKRNSHRVKIVPLLMELYSRAKTVYVAKDYADADQRRIIMQPCCCIYGTSTPERFCEGISPDELRDGWLSRCMVFVTNTEPGKNRSNCDASIPKSILERVETWYGRQIGETDGKNIGQFAAYHGTAGVTLQQPPEQLLVSTAPEAEKLFIALDDESNTYRKHTPELACLWAKAEENARRVALIVAAGVEFESPEITASIADYACRLIRYLLLDFRREIAPWIVDGQIERDKNKILRIVKKAGIGGATRNKVLTHTRGLESKRRESLLADLIAAEEIMQYATGPKGGIFYWTPEHFTTWAQKNPEKFASLVAQQKKR